MIENGKTYTQEITVTSQDTAAAYGSGKLAVFATPAMIALMENTAIRCIEGELEAGSDTVGIEINTRHMKATGVGGKVWCKATVTETDGRRIRFEVDVWDEKGPVGHAVHDRFIINPEKFMSKL